MADDPFSVHKAGKQQTIIGTRIKSMEITLKKGLTPEEFSE